LAINKFCAACGTHSKIGRAHIRTRGAGAGWEDWEWIYLCRRHHQLQHVKGWAFICNAFPNVLGELKSKGWEIEEIFGVKKVVRK
jgi:hypothetical protein